MLMRLTAVLTVGAALTLGACAVDSQMSYVSYLPDFLKQSSPVAKVEVPPDVPAILRSNINILFVSTSAPTNIQYSLPVPAKHGGWETRILKLDRLRLRGPNGARDEFILAATAQNLRMGNDGKLADGRKGIRSGGPSLTRQ